MADSEAMGPVSYLVVEFPGSNMTGDGFPALVDLVDRGLIRVLDLVFVARGLDGTTTRLELADIDGDGDLDLSVFEGASSGLLDEGDIFDAGSVLEPGSSAGILVFENRWATPFVHALREGGGELVAAGYIPHRRAARSSRIHRSVTEANGTTRNGCTDHGCGGYGDGRIESGLPASSQPVVSTRRRATAPIRAAGTAGTSIRAAGTAGTTG